MKGEIIIVLVVANARCCPSANATAGLGGQNGGRRGIKRSRFPHAFMQKLHFVDTSILDWRQE
jgi:hypothetical protein